MKFYTVVFADVNGFDQISRHFDTIRAARSWRKWLNSQKWATNVRIYEGGIGGIVVS